VNRKDLFNLWAPHAAGPWTKFAKPALFVHIDDFALVNLLGQIPSIPGDIAAMLDGKTAVVVDLPCELSVETGIALAQMGLRPVPLYNGIHEKKIGTQPIVENAATIDALVSATDVLRHLEIDETAPPAFLLDYDRTKNIADATGMFDNRWSLDFEDMPDAAYVKDAGIERLVIWSHGQLNDDLMPIMDSYYDAGITVIIFDGGKVVERSNGDRVPIAASVPSPIVIPKMLSRFSKDTANNDISANMRDSVRKFENARFGMLLVILMAVVNLFFMFFMWHQPLLWTTPTIMWLTYLWVPELLGDFIAVLFVAGYIALYFMSQKRRKLMTLTLAIMLFETLVLWIYAISYGLDSYTGYSFWYGVLVFGLPIVFIVFLVKGTMQVKNLEDVNFQQYCDALEKIDVEAAEARDDDNMFGPMGVGRRHFRGFRGYGGSGLGGYRGSGGYGGGYGGGFGG